MNRNKIIKCAIEIIKDKRENVIRYLNENDTLSYDLCDLNLQHYVYNIMISTRMTGSRFNLSSYNFIMHYIPVECTQSDIISSKEVNLKTICVNWHKYYEFLIDDYENILAKFQSEIMDTKTKLTVSEIIALISSVSGAIVSILTAISRFQ